MPGLAMMVRAMPDELDGAVGERFGSQVEHVAQAEVVDDRLGEGRERSMVGEHQVAHEVVNGCPQRRAGCRRP